MIGRWAAAAQQTLNRVHKAIQRFAGILPNEGTPGRVYWDEGVALALSDLVQEAETRASGRVQVITLADFRGAIGELWDRYESRILLIAETTISRMIGRGNTFIPQDKDTWLLLFPALSEPEALKRADSIAARIGEKLVGAQFTETPPPLPEASKLNLSSAMNADGTLNLDRVKEAVENVRIAANPALARPPVVKTPIKNVRPSIAPPATPQAKSEANQCTITFRPAWNAETQSVNAFFFRAVRPDGSDVFSPSLPPPNDATVLEFLGVATRFFIEMCEKGLRATLAIPVPYLSLRGSTLVEIQRLISALPQSQRLMHLRLEITQIPLRIGADALVPIRERFRPYVRDVAFLLDPFQLAEQALALDHIMAGVEFSRAARRSDEEIFQAMLVFRQRAGQKQIYVLGLSSRLQVAHAVTAGISELGGAGVLAEMKKLPDQVTVIRGQDLLL